MTKRFETEDLYKLECLSNPIYLGKDKIIYVKSKISKEKNNYQSKFIIRNLENKEEKEFGFEDSLNIKVQVLNGEKILFISNETGKKQVYLLDLASEKIEKITNMPFGVDDVRWDPSGKRIYFSSRLKEDQKEFDQSTEYEFEEKKDYIETESMDYFTNDRGFIEDHVKELIFYQELDSKVARVISEHAIGYGFVNSFVVSSDGKYLAISKEDGKDKLDRRSSIQIFNTEDFSIYKNLNSDTSYQVEPVFSPDNKKIAFACASSYHTSIQPRLFVYDFEEDKTHDLTGEFDIQVGDLSSTDINCYMSHSPISFANDSKSVYFLSSYFGKMQLFNVDMDKNLDKLEDIKENITEFVVNRDNSKILALASEPDVVTEFIEYDPKNKTKNIILDSKIDRYTAKYENLKIKSRDNTDIYALLAKPHDYDPSKKYPLVVSIHGGPYIMFTENFFFEVQLLVSQGYLVLLPNPRGSIGFGQAYTKDVVGNYGKRDYTDIMDFVNYLLEDLKIVDPDRMAVIGGSYGGFMTNLITTRTDIFKLAITQRSIADFVSQWGSSDIGYYFYKDEMGADISNREILWEASPIKNVDKVKTKTLVIHSEHDYRCPLTQGQMWYQSLKYFGVDAKLLIFRGENHGLSRNGKPSNRIKRLSEMVNFLSEL